MISLLVGYILDLIIGDPQWMPHPIRLIGNMITTIEQNLRDRCKNKQDELNAGVILWLTVVLSSYIVPFCILFVVAKINLKLAIILEGIMCYYILATRSLKDESMKVYYKLKENNIDEARRYLSYIVGRDTEKLDEVAIAKATVETVAENTSDGVIAPMMYMMIGGAPLGFMYKAINTLDSMVGYKNDKYINIGRFSALSDDVANYIPSRISAYIMILASWVIKMEYKKAYQIYKRDRLNHLSPNSAQTEAVCSGALNIMLGGVNYYGGKPVEKQTIGDDTRLIEIEDIKKANRLMYATSLIFLALSMTLIFWGREIL